MFTLFLTFVHSNAQHPQPDQAELGGIAGFLRATHGMTTALIHTPAIARDPYLHDGPSPSLVLQIYFADIAALEAACAEGGHLHALAAPGILPSLAEADVTQQAMLARPFPVSEPAPPTAPGCSYLVAYEGEAEDLNAWLTYYIAHHPPIMRRFPGIRAIEIDTRIDWCSALPFHRADAMQRNKVVFDSPAALDAALNSPVRHEMRADFAKFPPFAGGNTHYPMLTRPVLP